MSKKHKSLGDALRAARDGEEPEKMITGITRKDFEEMILALPGNDSVIGVPYLSVNASAMLAMNDDRFKMFYTCPGVDYIGSDKDIHNMHLRGKQLGL